MTVRTWRPELKVADHTESVVGKLLMLPIFRVSLPPQLSISVYTEDSPSQLSLNPGYDVGKWLKGDTDFHTYTELSESLLLNAEVMVLYVDIQRQK